MKKSSRACRSQAFIAIKNTFRLIGISSKRYLEKFPPIWPMLGSMSPIRDHCWADVWPILRFVGPSDPKIKPWIGPSRCPTPNLGPLRASWLAYLEILHITVQFLANDPSTNPGSRSRASRAGWAGKKAAGSDAQKQLRLHAACCHKAPGRCRWQPCRDLKGHAKGKCHTRCALMKFSSSHFISWPDRG